MKKTWIGVSLLFLAVVGSLYLFKGWQSNSIEDQPINGAADFYEPKVANESVYSEPRVITFNLIATSVNDEKAVLSLSSSKTRVVAVGDVLDASETGYLSLKIARIAIKKIVLMDTDSEETYFVYLQDEQGLSRIQKISNTIQLNELPTITPVLRENSE
jgi:hypothetical protein